MVLTLYTAAAAMIVAPNCLLLQHSCRFELSDEVDEKVKRVSMIRRRVTLLAEPVRHRRTYRTAPDCEFVRMGLELQPRHRNPDARVRYLSLIHI